MASSEPITGRCAARIKRGGFCELYPMTEQTRCQKHGGKAPQNVAAAQRRLAEKQAAAIVVRYGDAVPVNPIDAIEDTLNRLNGACIALRNVIAELEPKALVWGKAEVTKIGSTQFPGVDKKFAAGINPFVELYERNLRELARLSVDALKVGVVLRREQRDADLGAQILETLLTFAELLGHARGPDVLAVAQQALLGTKPKELE